MDHRPLSELDALTGVCAINLPRREQGAQIVERDLAAAEVYQVEVELHGGHQVTGFLLVRNTPSCISTKSSGSECHSFRL